MASGYPSAVIFGAFRISPQDSQRAWVAGSTCPALHEPNGGLAGKSSWVGATELKRSPLNSKYLLRWADN